MKAVLGGAVALVLSAAGWFGWNEYESKKETDAAVSAVQVSATQTERQMNARSEDGITFAEYFKRSGSTIENLDREIETLESRPWKYMPSDRDTAITFIEQCKAMVRSGQAETRLLMSENTAQEAYEDAKKDLDEADSTHAIDWALKRFQRTSDDLLEIISKKITNVEESVGKTEKMIAADEAVKLSFGAESGLSQATVEKMKKYVKSAEGSKAKQDQPQQAAQQPAAS